MSNAKYALTPLLNTRTRYADLEYASPYTKEFLDEKSMRGDPLGDDLIVQMDKDGILEGAWRDLIDVVVERAKTHGGVYQDYIDYCNKVPDWVDFDLMKPSQEMIFNRIPNTLLTGGVAFFGGAYIPSALSVAAASQFMEQGKPRLIESVTFIIKPALGMKPGSIAHFELIRVRLIHSAIRFFMGKKRGQHPGDQLLGDCEYVNQSQMAYFLTSFSFLHLRTAIRMGMKLSDEEIMSHHHRWQYMGYLMGIDNDLLTDTLEDEKKLAMALQKKETKPDLTDTFFVDLIQKSMGGHGKTQKARDKSFLEFKAVLLYAIGEDFIGGWGMSWNDPGMKEALRRAKRKTALMDFLQRQKPIAMLQYYIVKKRFLSGRKKLLAQIETTGGEDTLGEVSAVKKERSYMLKRFDALIEKMET